tara:strand:+ start:95 stop:259 length:165 start_codon:yes stop_codon:yes gene_type:complete
MRCFSKKRRIAALKKVAQISFHVGYWSMVSGFVVSNFLYYGILQEKIRNDNLET